MLIYRLIFQVEKADVVVKTMIDHMTDIQSGATYKLSLQQGQEFTVLFYFYFTLRDIFNLIITVSLWSI